MDTPFEACQHFLKRLLLPGGVGFARHPSGKIVHAYHDHVAALAVRVTPEDGVDVQQLVLESSSLTHILGLGVRALLELAPCACAAEVERINLFAGGFLHIVGLLADGGFHFLSAWMSKAVVPSTC